MITPAPATSSEYIDVQRLHGVGPQVAAKLERLGIFTAQDLLFLLPSRYEDRTRVVPIGGLRIGQRAVVEGEIQLTEVVFRGRRSLLCRIGDGSGFLTLRFFHFSNAQQKGLARGTTIRCFGEARAGKSGIEMVHPEYRLLGDQATAVEDTLTPIYPTTEGLQQGRLRGLVKQALNLTARKGIDDWVPKETLTKLSLPALADAISVLHRPPKEVNLEELAEGRHPAQVRLAFEELLAHHLSLRSLRAKVRHEAATPLDDHGNAVEHFVATHAV